MDIDSLVDSILETRGKPAASKSFLRRAKPHIKLFAYYFDCIMIATIIGMFFFVIDSLIWASGLVAGRPGICMAGLVLQFAFVLTASWLTYAEEEAERIRMKKLLRTKRKLHDVR